MSMALIMRLIVQQVQRGGLVATRVCGFELRGRAETSTAEQQQPEAVAARQCPAATPRRRRWWQARYSNQPSSPRRRSINPTLALTLTYH